LKINKKIKWHGNAIAGQFFGISEDTEGQKTLWVLPLGRDKKFHLNDISQIDLSRSNLDELSPVELDEVNKAFGTRFGKCFENESKKVTRKIILTEETQAVIKKLEDTVSINFAILDETIGETNIHLEQIAIATKKIAQELIKTRLKEE
tara:strand:+ start:315 stop:761 length:447 start_codon:yes stop_codon:yes gene_type:complete